jgi:hypothetical protein
VRGRRAAALELGNASADDFAHVDQLSHGLVVLAATKLGEVTPDDLVTGSPAT